MPLGTDLSKLLVRQDELTTADVEQVRLSLNQVQSQVSALSGIVDAQGNLDHNVFSHKAGRFSQLPHETASMHKSVDTAVQTINHATSTPIVFTADATLSAAELRLSWAHGIRRDISTGEFFLEGIPEHTIWFFTGELWWRTLPTTLYLYAMEKDTATGFILSWKTSASAPSGRVMGSTMMRARKAATSWQLVVYQESSGASKDVDWATFQVMRVR
jgi:hypothetical protein